MDAVAGKYMLIGQISICADIRPAIADYYLRLILSRCECDGVDSVMFDPDRIGRLNAGQWCVMCMFSYPYTRSSKFQFAQAFKFDHARQKWCRIAGCICPYLSAGEMNGFSTCCKLERVNEPPNILSPCSYYWNRYGTNY